MNYVTADEGLLARLRGLVEVVEIRDPSGTVLGHYTPVLAATMVRALQDEAEALFDLEEADRVAATEHQGRTTAEVMQYLQSLEKQG